MSDSFLQIAERQNNDSGIIAAEKRRDIHGKVYCFDRRRDTTGDPCITGCVHFADYMKKAITIFVEAIEKDPDLGPEDFIITSSARKGQGDRKRK